MDSIRGIGPKRAIDLIQEHKSIENILKSIDSKKYVPPEDWNFEGARNLFLEPDVADPTDIEVKKNSFLYPLKLIDNCRKCSRFYRFFFQFKWTDPDEEGLVKYLCGDKQFNEERVRNGAKKLMKARGGSTQGRLDGFFTVLPSSGTPKRKADTKKDTPNKKGKGGGKGRGRAK